MMPEMRTLVHTFGAGIALIAISGVALADGYETGPAPAPVEQGRKFTYSFGLAGTSDYVFRGVSQTDNDPTVQGSINLGYGIFYAGVWGSGLDFGGGPSTGFGEDAQVELDWYGGIKPTWNSPFGKMDLDFGVIYYNYPGAGDNLAELDYVEFKAAYSWSVLHPSLTTGTAVYYSPDYTFETGSVWTVESLMSWTLPEVWVFTPVISGVLGTQYGDSGEGYSVDGTNDDKFYYWNAGLALGVGNITMDFRYWDTDIGNAAGGSVCARTNLCDERFVATVSVSVP